MYGTSAMHRLTIISTALSNETSDAATENNLALGQQSELQQMSNLPQLAITLFTTLN